MNIGKNMATVRTIIHYPDPKVLQSAETVKDFTDPELQNLIDDMIATTYAADGAGLAAPQIGVSLRVAIVNPSDKNTEAFEIINPEILEMSGEWKVPEGCLSIPKYYDTVNRSAKVRVRYYDRHGKMHEVIAEDKLAHIFQHEIDHLSGILYIHRLSPIKRHMFELKNKKMQKRK